MISMGQCKLKSLKTNKGINQSHSHTLRFNHMQEDKNNPQAGNQNHSVPCKHNRGDCKQKPDAGAPLRSSSSAASVTGATKNRPENGNTTIVSLQIPCLVRK